MHYQSAHDSFCPIGTVLLVLAATFVLAGCSSDLPPDPQPDRAAVEEIRTMLLAGGDANTAASAGNTASPAPAASPAGDLAWGTLRGQFIYDGAPPRPAAVAVTRDQQFCGQHESLVDESLIVNPNNRGLANVVVVLNLGPGRKLPGIHPDYQQTANASVKLDNRNCRFEPHVVTLRTTQTLVIGNPDPVGHNTNILVTDNPGINPVVPAGQSIQHKFSQPERSPAEVKCSIHPWMSARIVVKDHPYMAVSDADGKFAIANLPAGKWEFQVWQEKSGAVTTVTQNGKQVTWRRGRVELEIKPGDNDLGTIAVAASNFPG